MSDEREADYVGRTGNGPDERAYGTVMDILNGRVSKPSRDQLRDALDKAPADSKTFPRVR